MKPQNATFDIVGIIIITMIFNITAQTPYTACYY